MVMSPMSSPPSHKTCGGGKTVNDDVCVHGRLGFGQYSME